MTVVAAIEVPGGVVMGCDSGVLVGTSVEVIDHAKWFRRLGGALVIGYAGDVRGAQVAQGVSRFRPRKVGESDETYLGNVVAASIHRALYHAPGARNADVGFLYVYCGRIYSPDASCGVTRSARRYGACGTGEDMAVGVIAALLAEGREPEYAMGKALEVCGEHLTAIKPKFRVEMIRWPR